MTGRPRRSRECAGFVTLVTAVLVGCATLPAGVPPRYEAPKLPGDDVASIAVAGAGVGIYLVDGGLPVEETDYNMDGLKKPLPTEVRVLPGTHDITFGCWMSGSITQIATNITVSAGERYKVSRRTIGYSMSILIEKE